MALTTEQLQLQVDILTSKTDNATNPGFKYYVNQTLNKALDPEYFTTANSTKIVNAINECYKLALESSKAVDKSTTKINAIILDTDSLTGAKKWEETQTLMGAGTIIDALHNLYSGKDHVKILGVTEEFVDKLLTVSRTETGELKLNPIEVAVSQIVDATSVAYTHEDHPEIVNVKMALDYLFANGVTSGPVGSLKWEDIQDKPDLADGLELNENYLILKSGENQMSSIDLMNVEDVNSLVGELG